MEMLDGLASSAVTPQRRRRSSAAMQAAVNSATAAITQLPAQASPSGTGRKGRTAHAKVNAGKSDVTGAAAINASPPSVAAAAANGLPHADAITNGDMTAVSPTGRKPAVKRGRKATASAKVDTTAQLAGVDGPAEDAAPPKAKRSRKTRVLAAAQYDGEADLQNGTEAAAADAETGPASAKKPRGKRRKKVQAAAGGDGAAQGDADAGEAAAAKPKKKRTPKVTWPPGAVLPSRNTSYSSAGLRGIAGTAAHHQRPAS